MTGYDDSATGAGAADAPKSALRLRVFVSPAHVIPNSESTFSPTTSTLVFGDHEAVLVDAQYITQDIEDLGDMIEQVGRKLTTIFITHGHADHYFGMDRLAARFPGTRIVAASSVVEDINARGDEQVATFSAWFGDQLVIPTSSPQPIDGDTLVLEGHPLRVIEVEQADIAPSAVLYVPELGAVIAGDLAYNGIHQMLGLGGPIEWDKWAASVEAIAALEPRIVVAGHKKPDAGDDDAAGILNSTRSYIRDFTRTAKTASSTRELVSAMQALYPEHGNLNTLLFSARAVMGSK